MPAAVKLDLVSSSFRQRCRYITAGFRRAPPKKTPSLLSTLFGDLVEPHGGEIWLGSLIQLLAPLGVSERLVRTSVYRLAQDGWIEGIKEGRRSYYHLTTFASQQAALYERRIYHFSEQAWNGEWELIFTGTQGVDTEQRTELRKRLGWLGFGIIAPNVFGHPTAPMGPVWEIFSEMKITAKVVVMRATNYDEMRGLGTLEMVRQCFKLEALEKDYSAFIKRYRPLTQALESDNGGVDGTPEACCILRAMLIHHYRRILVRDPELPAPLLPDDWAGHHARQICARLYRAIEPTSEEHILAVCKNRSGAFEPTAPGFRNRFSA